MGDGEGGGGAGDSKELKWIAGKMGWEMPKPVEDEPSGEEILAAEEVLTVPSSVKLREQAIRGEIPEGTARNTFRRLMGFRDSFKHYSKSVILPMDSTKGEVVEDKKEK